MNKGRDRAIHVVEFGSFVRVRGNLGRIRKSSLPRKLKERNKNRRKTNRIC